MTDDLVKRLRKRTDPFKMVTTVPIQDSPDWICQEAADRIEVLETALREIRQSTTLYGAQTKARKALEEKDV